MIACLLDYLIKCWYNEKFHTWSLILILYETYDMVVRLEFLAMLCIAMSPCVRGRAKDRPADHARGCRVEASYSSSAPSDAFGGVPGGAQFFREIGASSSYGVCHHLC